MPYAWRIPIEEQFPASTSSCVLPPSWPPAHGPFRDPQRKSKQNITHQGRGNHRIIRSPAPLFRCPPTVVLPSELGSGVDATFEGRELIQSDIVALIVSQETPGAVGRYYHPAGGGGVFFFLFLRQLLLFLPCRIFCRRRCRRCITLPLPPSLLSLSLSSFSRSPSLRTFSTLPLYIFILLSI